MDSSGGCLRYPRAFRFRRSGRSGPSRLAQDDDGRTFAPRQPDLVIDFPANRQDRRTLPNGAEFFGASGKITNVGKTAQYVPSILIVLRDARDRIVYSWEVVPPKRELAPGEAMTINEAVTDVPKSAVVAEIGWKLD